MRHKKKSLFEPNELSIQTQSSKLRHLKKGSPPLSTVDAWFLLAVVAVGVVTPFVDAIASKYNDEYYELPQDFVDMFFYYPFLTGLLSGVFNISIDLAGMARHLTMKWQERKAVQSIQLEPQYYSEAFVNVYSPYSLTDIERLNVKDVRSRCQSILKGLWHVAESWAIWPTMMFLAEGGAVNSIELGFLEPIEFNSDGARNNAIKGFAGVLLLVSFLKGANRILDLRREDDMTNRLPVRLITSQNATLFDFKSRESEMGSRRVVSSKSVMIHKPHIGSSSDDTEHHLSL